MENRPSAAPQKFGVVLVHGGFVDGSGWEDVYKIFKSHGYKASIVQNPMTFLLIMYQA